MITENCLNKIETNSIDVISIPDKIPPFVTEDYDLFDDKDRNKYIMDLERFVRSSYEYRNMVQYLRNYMNMNSCAFIPAVTNEITTKVRIEIHHSPFTLRDICSTIFNKRSKLHECLDIEAVAYEVVYVHYCLMVGLIPLSETVHELVHTQYIFVPCNKVYGYYKQFVSAYYDYIDPELLDRLDELEKLTIEGLYNEQYKQVLEKKYVAVDMGGNSQLEQIHELQSMLKDRLSELREDDVVNTTNDIPIMHTNNIEPLVYNVFTYL